MRLDKIRCLLDKRESHPIHAERQPELQIGEVLGGERRHFESRARQVYTLAIGNHATCHDLSFYPLRVDAGHLHANTAVVNQQVLAVCHRIEDFSVRQRYR
ncbi:hypothetical protein D3C87_1766690 [compost metagenome]